VPYYLVEKKMQTIQKNLLSIVQAAAAGPTSIKNSFNVAPTKYFFLGKDLARKFLIFQQGKTPIIYGTLGWAETFKNQFGRGKRGATTTRLKEMSFRIQKVIQTTLRIRRGGPIKAIFVPECAVGQFW